MKNWLVGVLTITFVLSVFVQASDAREQAKSDASAETPFCHVAKNPAVFVGKAITVDARYKSDNQHFEFLENSSCNGGDAIIQVGSHGTSVSIRKFDADIRRGCERRNATIVCNSWADVKATGSIRLIEGKYYLDLDELRVLKFVVPPQIRDERKAW